MAKIIVVKFNSVQLKLLFKKVVCESPM